MLTERTVSVAISCATTILGVGLISFAASCKGFGVSTSLLTGFVTDAKVAVGLGKEWISLSASEIAPHPVDLSLVCVGEDALISTMSRSSPKELETEVLWDVGS